MSIIKVFNCCYSHSCDYIVFILIYNGQFYENVVNAVTFVITMWLDYQNHNVAASITIAGLIWKLKLNATSTVWNNNGRRGNKFFKWEPQEKSLPNFEEILTVREKILRNDITLPFYTFKNKIKLSLYIVIRIKMYLYQNLIFLYILHLTFFSRSKQCKTLLIFLFIIFSFLLILVSKHTITIMVVGWMLVIDVIVVGMAMGREGTSSSPHHPPCQKKNFLVLTPHLSSTH